MQIETFKVLEEIDDICAVCECCLDEHSITISVEAKVKGLDLTLEEIKVCEECFEKCDFNLTAVEYDGD